MSNKRLTLKIDINVTEEDYGKCYDYLRNIKATAISEIPTKYKADCEVYLV